MSQLKLAQLGKRRRAIRTACLAEISAPWLSAKPAGGAGRNGRRLAVHRKDRGYIRIAPTADMGEIAGVRLKMGGMAGVIGNHHAVDVRPLHCAASQVPAPIALG